jgi:hypothetical protein
MTISVATKARAIVYRTRGSHSAYLLAKFAS